MAWTAPRTWVSGETVTAALMNAQIRDNELVLSAVPDLQIFSTTGGGTWTKPTDMKWAVAEGWAGGGSGSSAGGGAGQAVGGGGGGGGYFKKLYAASDLQATEALSVGLGGNGTAGDGNPGLTSTFKGCTANPGTNGQSMNSSTGSALSSGGGGGSATGGDENLTGDDGGKGRVFAGVADFSNVGGASPRGGGRSTFLSSSAGIGTAGKVPGGGGSGSFAGGTGFNGPSGGNGRIIVTSYYS